MCKALTVLREIVILKTNLKGRYALYLAVRCVECICEFVLVF